MTEKLLTGFDAPVLYCMYLDKPMRDHVLLQAIARVNRPYEDEDGLVKPYGFVLDFVGIFEKLEKALAFDSDVVASVIQNIDVLRELFATLMREQAPAYLPLTRGLDDKAKERAVVALQDKDRREAFFKFFRQLQSLYDILSPDAFLRPYLDDYQALAVLYAWIRQAYSDRVYVDREFTRKTKQLCCRSTPRAAIWNRPRSSTKSVERQLARPQRERCLGHREGAQPAQAAGGHGRGRGRAKPYLLSIGERAQALAEAYENRQLDTKEALEAL